MIRRFALLVPLALFLFAAAAHAADPHAGHDHAGHDHAGHDHAAPEAAPASGTEDRAGTPGTDPSDLGFAEALFREGDYYRAITEAKRQLHYSADKASAARARLLIGRSYLAGEQWTAAAAILESLSAEVYTGPVGADAAFALGETRLGARDFDLAALEFRRFAEDFPEDPRAPFADLNVGWARIRAADAIARGNPKKGRVAFRSAAQQLESLPEDHAERERVEALATGARRLADLPRRSPAAAGVLSAVLPGAGQVYAGRYADGFIALLVNGLFIGGAYESFNRGNNVAGVVLVLFETGWYSGNIYSAINSAHRYNEERRAAVLNDLEKQVRVHAAPRVSSSGRTDGWVVGLGGRF